MDYKEESLKRHLEFKGKIEIKSRFPEIKNKDDLAVAYTPGVAAVSSLLATDPEKAYTHSIKGNTIAVVSDGSAVLGLGNIGPLGALPVMEGKALLFKQFAGVDAYPIVLATQDTEEIIKIVKAISPTFAGINLEDISAPRCFEVEQRLIKELDIPVFHDDQHGTAIVVLAALINSLKLVKKEKENLKVVVSGSGAAGISVAKLLLKFGVKNVVLVDSKGIVSRSRTDLNDVKKEMLEVTNLENIEGDLADASKGADVFVGVSAPGIFKPEFVKSMAEKPIIFAMSNPIPEIMPDLAREAGAYIVGTGRSDFPNQINNVLVFPGLFRGLIDNRIRVVTDEIKLAVADAISGCISEKELTVENIIPSALDKSVVESISKRLSDFK